MELVAPFKASESAEFFSREASAGLDRERLARSTVLIVGTGALGQYVADVLGRCQVGQLWLVDFDTFEPHNATRSPFYPTADEASRWRGRKAPTVANKLKAALHFSDLPVVTCLDGPIQSFGDAPIEAADVIVSCVDNDAARDHLRMMARRHRKPLVVGTFGDSTSNCSVYGPDPADPCWRCHAEKNITLSHARQGSCDKTAAAVLQAGYIPVTPMTAQFSGALVSHSVVELLHGARGAINRFHFSNMRGATLVTPLSRNEECHCHEDDQPSEIIAAPINPRENLKSLLAWAQTLFPSPRAWLPKRFIVRWSCVETGKVLRIESPDWRITSPPRSIECGGEWPEHDNQEAVPADHAVVVLGEDDHEFLEFTCEELGVAPGGLVLITGDGGQAWVRVGEFSSDEFSGEPAETDSSSRLRQIPR